MVTFFFILSTDPFPSSIPPLILTSVYITIGIAKNSLTTFYNSRMQELLTSQKLVLGPAWVPVYLSPVDFSPTHFETAMAHLIREPNINSTVILRADVLEESTYTEGGEVESSGTFSPDLPERDSAGTENSDLSLLHRDLSDVTLRKVPLADSIKLKPVKSVIRRIIPRNPYKDHIINQTCLIHKGDESVLVVYVPHISSMDETPFYLPPVHAVGILFDNNTLSIHYVPFEEDSKLRDMDATERPIRIALRLLQTLAKHSLGVKAGYEKRVNHDLVVPRVAFQNRYIALKKKYSGPLVANWVESTDPKKHVFEDLAVAAFLIELWNLRYKDKDFEFRDLGCGNGLLVHILILEGFKGKGIDARARKSWKTYPATVQENLLEQIIIPSVLLKPHPAVARMAPYIRDNGRLFQVAEFESKTPSSVPLMKYYSSANLLELSKVCTTEDFSPNTFLIGNHLDELTCWLPLLDYPFMVIPCCSHALNGAKVRYNPRKMVNPQTKAKLPPQNVSTYGALVDHVEELSEKMGWVVEKEILRIPSTRNAAIIGMTKQGDFANEPLDVREMRTIDIIAMEGGAEGWVENLMVLMKKSPKNH